MAEPNPIHDVILMDDALCALTPEGVLIDPLARPVRWLPFWLLAVLAALGALLLLMSLFSIQLTVVGLVGWLLRNTILAAALLVLVVVLYVQWTSLRQPVVGINPSTELIVVERSASVRRIPFSVVTSLRIASDPANNSVDRGLNRIYEQFNVPRRGIGLVLQHGEVVWCGVVSGVDARERARNIRQRISECITSTR